MGSVIVAGAINTDFVARTARFPSPGETVLGADFAVHPGGKGSNQAVAAARIGAPTRMIGRLGSDTFGDQLEMFLRRNNVDISGVSREPSLPTGTALITVREDGENQIVIIPGANWSLRPEDFTDLRASPGDVLVTQLEIPLETVQAFLSAGRLRQATTVLNPSPTSSCCSRQLLDLADIIIVNEPEARAFSETPTVSDYTNTSSLVALARNIQTRPNQSVVLTRGPLGVLAFGPKGAFCVPGWPVAALDTTGAGDCFVGALSAALAKGSALKTALRFANAAAALSVQRPGAGSSMPMGREVEELLRKPRT